MDTIQAAKLARELMDLHGLADWTFGWDRAVRRNGACKFAKQTISLSYRITQLREESQVRNTILHEIAHALVGPGHGHGLVWWAKAKSIGCSGERCTPGPTPQARYRRVCQACGEEYGKFHRRPRVRGACTSCCRKYNNGRYDVRFALVVEVVK